MTLYGLARGRQWIHCPSEREKIDALPPGSPLLDRSGDPVYLPGLALAPDPAEAWVTHSLAVAIERREMLRLCLPGVVTVVRRVP